MSLAIFFALTFLLPLGLARWSGYCRNVLLGWDYLGSAMTGGRAGETLSGRTGSSYLEHKFKGYLFCPVIDFIMYTVRAYPKPRGHCLAAVIGDQQRAQAVLADYQGTAQPEARS